MAYDANLETVITVKLKVKNKVTEKYTEEGMKVSILGDLADGKELIDNLQERAQVLNDQRRPAALFEEKDKK